MEKGARGRRADTQSLIVLTPNSFFFPLLTEGKLAVNLRRSSCLPLVSVNQPLSEAVRVFYGLPPVCTETLFRVHTCDESRAAASPQNSTTAGDFSASFSLHHRLLFPFSSFDQPTFKATSTKLRRQESARESFNLWTETCGTAPRGRYLNDKDLCLSQSTIDFHHIEWKKRTKMGVF